MRAHANDMGVFEPGPLACQANVFTARLRLLAMDDGVSVTFFIAEHLMELSKNMLINLHYLRS